MTRTQNAVEIHPGIVVDTNVVGGTPVIRGTRIPARLIVGQLAGGESMRGIMQAYDLTEEQVRAALGYAATVLADESVYTLPTE